MSFPRSGAGEHASTSLRSIAGHTNFNQNPCSQPTAPEAAGTLHPSRSTYSPPANTSPKPILAIPAAPCIPVMQLHSSEASQRLPTTLPAHFEIITRPHRVQLHASAGCGEAGVGAAKRELGRLGGLSWWCGCGGCSGTWGLRFEVLRRDVAQFWVGWGS